MSTVSTRPRSVKAGRKPVEARLDLEVNGTAYVVTPIDPGPDNQKAWRLEKLTGDGKVYDVARTVLGLVECDCPDYEARHRGNGLGTCKHGTALVMVGLLDTPTTVGIPTGLLNSANPIAPDFDEPYVIANIVARGDACWINQGPKGGPTPPCWTTTQLLLNSAKADPEPEPAPDTDGISYEDDGLGLDDDEDADEDGLGGDWDDESRWEPGAGPGLSLAQLADHEAAIYRSWRTDAGRLFADHMAHLASLIRSLDAMTPGAFLDRLDAMHDAAAL